jgi:hypothetical protein
MGEPSRIGLIGCVIGIAACLGEDPAIVPPERRSSTEDGGLGAVSDASADRTESTQTCVALPEGARAWWTGDSVLDDRTGAYPLTVSTPSYAPSHVGDGFRVTSFETSPLTANTTAFGGLPGLTVEAWIKVEALIGGLARIADYNSSTNGSDDGWSLRLDGGKASFAVSGTGGGSITSGPTLPLGVFRHVAGVFTSGAVRIFVDGNKEGDRPIAATATGAGMATSKVRLGSSADTARDRFGGVIDELAIYGRALSDAEIKGIFDAGPRGKCK